MDNWILPAGFAVTLLAVVWLLRRPVAADRAVLRQNRDLHDALMSRFEDERGWLSHRRQMEDMAREQNVAMPATTATSAPLYGQAPMELDEEPTDVPLPSHGGGPLG